MTDYCPEASQPEQCSLSHTRTHAYMHKNCQLLPCILIMCTEKVKGHSGVALLAVSKAWTGVLLSVVMSTVIWPLGVTMCLLSPHLIGALDV